MSIFRIAVSIMLVASMFVASSANAQGDRDCGARDSLTTAKQKACLDTLVETKKSAIRARVEKIVASKSKLETDKIKLGEDWVEALGIEAEALFAFAAATCTVAWLEGGATSAGIYDLRNCQLERLNRFQKHLGKLSNRVKGPVHGCCPWESVNTELPHG